MTKTFLLTILIVCFILSGCVQATPTPTETKTSTNIDIDLEIETEPEAEVVEDEVVALLEEIETETGIDFSEIEDVEFNWNLEGSGMLTIEGKGFDAEEISGDEYGAVEAFFREKGLETDLHNIAAGTLVGLMGYKKDNIVCTVKYQAEEEDVIWATGKRDVEVKCGELTFDI